MKIYPSILLLSLSVVWLACNNRQQSVKEPVDYVNPYMGNISHLLVPTYPTIHLPNSMLRVYPERSDYTTDQIIGLPVVVTSHRGSSAFNISPYTGQVPDLLPIMRYSYGQEVIKPYRYGVYLPDEQIAVDYAPSHQSGVYQLDFEKNGDNHIVINTRKGVLSVDENQNVIGYQAIGHGAAKIYLYLESAQKPIHIGLLKDGIINPEIRTAEGKDEAIALTFQEKNVSLRYGVSFISSEQAEKNLRREMDTYDVDIIARSGRDIWNEALGKILVEGDEDMKTIFYTSLYRTYERMIELSEDGKYYSADNDQIYEDQGVPFFTDDWIWDTYRATHPLRVLIEPRKEEAMLASYIRMAEASADGWMPTFPEVTGDSHRMNGNHAVIAIWDAYVKGLRGFDLEAAYSACKGAIREKSLLPWMKIPLTELDEFYWENGFYPALYPGEEETYKDVHPFEKRQTISVILGNCYDNWCLAKIAETINNVSDYDYFLKASYNYRNVFNTETAFFHPKDKAGKFIMPFDYRFSGGQGARDYYGENNGWIYRWDVQHNVADLIDLMGGDEAFVRGLDEMFRTPLGRSKYSFYAQLPDHTGNVGQFSMANEPCLHIPYLYNYAKQPWKTQHRIHKLLKTWFRNDLMGVPGDEDGGGMSAFVVFSAMGFYPVTPGMPSYNIGTPMFEKSTIRVGEHNTFTIIARNLSKDNLYIQSAELNGKKWDKSWINHEDIIRGGKLLLVMGNKPNYKWATAAESVPSSAGKLR